MRDELLPRFSKETMPPIPPKEGTPGAVPTTTPPQDK
jgi:hypothetical protein